MTAEQRQELVDIAFGLVLAAQVTPYPLVARFYGQMVVFMHGQWASGER